MFTSVEQEARVFGRKMAQLRGKSHIPAQLLDLVDEVFQAQCAARAAASAEAPAEGSTAPLEKVVQGAPLLARADFGFDAAQAAGLFASFAGLLGRMGGPMAQAAALVLEGGDELRDKAFAAHISADAAFFDAFAAQTPQAPAALRFLAQSSLSPSITALAEALAARLPAERVWEPAACPVCGSLAFHSSLRGKEGYRVNSCSFCRADYRTVRLQCAYCEERDAAKLPYFTADEEPGFRVETCLTCKGYIKLTDFREFDRPSLPALDDLESLTLDILAARKGFSRPAPSAWGF